MVVTPTSISDEEKKLYKRLFEIENNKKNKESLFDKVREAMSGYSK